MSLHFLFRWMRTLTPSSANCAMCRKAFRQPHAKAQAADTEFMTHIAAVKFKIGFLHSVSFSFISVILNCSFSNLFVGVLSFSFVPTIIRALNTMKDV